MARLMVIPDRLTNLLPQHIEKEESSSPKESHPQALTDPDVSLSTHPAPIVQPQDASSISANEQIIEVFAQQLDLTSVLLFVAVL